MDAGTKFKLQKNSKSSFNPSGNNKKHSAPKQKSKKEMDYWKQIPPKEEELQSKKVKGKDFNWFAEQMVWGRHTEVDNLWYQILSPWVINHSWILWQQS